MKGSNNELGNGSPRESSSRCPFFYCLLHFHDDLDSNPEVTKPLYYIVDEVSSEQVRAFTSEREQEKLNRRIKSNKKGSPVLRVTNAFRKFFGTEPRRRRDSETASVTRVESAITTDEGELCEKPKNDFAVFLGNRSRLLFRCRKKPVKFEKRKWHFQKTFMCRFGDRYKNTGPDTPRITLSTKVIEKDDESSVEQNTIPSSNGMAKLGVTFPHPVYVRNCQLVSGDDDCKSMETTGNSRAWSLDANTMVGDGFTGRPIQAIVKTDTAYSWGSNGASLYPTDEQSSFQYSDDGDFDSESDIPFDEAAALGHPNATISFDSDCHRELYRISHPKSHYFADDVSENSLLWIDPQGSGAASDCYQFQPSGLCNVLNPANSLFYS